MNWRDERVDKETRAVVEVNWMRCKSRERQDKWWSHEGELEEMKSRATERDEEMRVFCTNIVFGWGDLREDGKHTKEKWVENIVFHCLTKERKY